MDSTNIELLRLICRGDKAAFDQVFRKYYICLRNYAFHITNDINASEDIVQDLFFRLWTNPQMTSKINSLEAYLRTSVYNRSIGLLKEKIKHSNTISVNQYIELEDIHLEILQYRQDAFNEKELGQAVDKAVEKLPEQCRIVFKLSRNFGLKNAEIAEHLGISVKGVEKHMTKALHFLKNDLKEFLPSLLL